MQMVNLFIKMGDLLLRSKGSGKLFIFLLGLIFVFTSCSPKEPVLTIEPVSLPDSIKVHDPDGNPSNGWLGTPDTVMKYDSVLVKLRISYSGPTDGYITEVIWRVRRVNSDSLIKTYSAVFYPIRIMDGESGNLNFYLYFDNLTAHKVDSLSDSTVDYHGEAEIELQLTGTTYEQFFSSNKLTFPLLFVP